MQQILKLGSFDLRTIHIIPVLLSVLHLCLAQITDPPVGPLRPVAEFERSQGVLISYPLGIPLDFVAGISQDDLIIYCLVDAGDQDQAVIEFTAAGIAMDHVEFIPGAIDSWWTQDYGPYFVVDANHEMVIVDFEYNRPRPFDNQAPWKMSQLLDVAYFDSDIVHNGGNLMFDGYNTAASSTLVYPENPWLDLDQYMLEYYGASHHMTADDPTLNFHQHINCWAKYLSPEKIMVKEVPPSHPKFAETEAVADFYAGQLNCFGEYYQVFRVYTPEDEPYVNSLILNDRVYLPVSGGQWDDEAVTSFQTAMPGYEVIPVNYWDWWPDDALHCRVLAIPDLHMLQMFHNPVNNQDIPLNEYPLEIILDPLSDSGLIPDSLRVFWKNDLMDEYQLQFLEWTGENDEYSSSIPMQPIDTLVDYFFTAADSSGRIERLPIAGTYQFAAIGGEPMELGDVNLDAVLNILDLILIVNHIINTELLDGYPRYLADVNQDDVVNIFDIIVLLNIIVNG